MRPIYLTLTAGLLLASVPLARADLADAIRTIVHDSLITSQDVNMWNEQTQDQLLRDYARDPEALRRKMAEMQGANLEQLVQRQLILHDFNANVKLPPGILDVEVDKEVEREIRTRYGGDRMRMIKTLHDNGLTLEKLRQQIKDRIVISIMRQKNVSSDLVASPHKIEAYYQLHKDEYKLEPKIQLRTILLKKPDQADAPSPKKLLEEIRQKVLAGASFAEMASVYSQGAQKKEGGNAGWWTKAELSKDLAEPAFALKKGEMSPVLDTSEGFYLLYAEDVQTSRYVPLTELRDRIERTILDNEGSRLEKLWIERLRKKTFVRYF